MASIDFFVVPTATFRVLFVFVVLSHARRRVLHFQVTEHPSQEWTMQQMREAFPWDHGCRSKHSRRMEPISRSTYGFCHGERGAVITSSIPMPFVMATKSAP
jgi:hypothetical protein